MKGESGMSALVAYECRRVMRSPVIWFVLALLLVAGTWGAANTARLHRRQAADVARMKDFESAWYEDVRTRAARYARPVTSLAEEPAARAVDGPAYDDHVRAYADLPYWQDPTDAAGFSRYFLRRFAAKPRLPLSVLATGQSDLQPFAVPLRLETLFGGDRVYDFEPPRGLATGPFDLSFVLVFVLPFGLGTAAAAVGAQERDQGILLFVASQAISPRRWWLVRLGALAAVLVPGVALCVALSLAMAGAPVLGAWMESIAAIALVTAQALFWLALAAWCLARGHGAVSTASIVAGIWLVLTVAAPTAGTLVVQALLPPFSPVAEVSDLRRTTDAVQAEANAIVARRLAQRLGPVGQSLDPPTLDYSTRLVLITEEMEERLAAQQIRRQARVQAGDRVARLLWWLSPQLAFETALTDLAGTGGARHQRFLEAVRAFQLDLRGFMYPRVLAQAGSPKPRACGGCPGRLNFVDYDAIPRFTMPDAPPPARAAAAFASAGWLTLVALLIAAGSIGRATGWAIES